MTDLFPLHLMATKTCSVLVAENRLPDRAWLATVIGTAPGIHVVGEAANGEEAVALAVETQPDVVLMSARLPGLSGTTATERIRAIVDDGPPKVIILTASGQHERLRDALLAGASGMLLRDTPPEQLVAAITAVAAGNLLLAPGLVSQVTETCAGGDCSPSPPFDIGSLKVARAPEPARSTALAEHLLFARDVHDVLGRTLAAIHRKSELVARLLAVEPERAPAELETVCSLARRSITEVRALAGGYRLGDLAAEIEGARSDLEVMGVRVDATDIPPALPWPVQEAFGWVAREAAANVLQHSNAVSCSIEVSIERRIAHLRITNDGAVQRGTSHGTGLAGLARRLGDVGGTLVHGPGPGPDLTYRVEATVPLDQ